MDLSDPAKYLPAGAGDDAGWIVSLGDRRTTDIAGGDRLWYTPGSSGDHISCQYADWLFHASRRHESVYRQLSIRKTHSGAVSRNPAIFLDTTAGRDDHHLLAGAQSDAGC